MSAKATTATQKRRFSPLVITSAIVIALIIAFTVFAGIMTDVLWYDQLGFIRVWATQWIAAAIMFLIGFFAMAIPLWLNLVIAYRKRPVYARINSQVERYKEAIDRCENSSHSVLRQPLARLRAVRSPRTGVT